jgi:hypothetical protein
MGAMLWHHEEPWQSDPATALRRLQAAFFAERYDFQTELERHRQSAEEALRLARNSGDRFGLVAIYSASLKVINDIVANPLPSDPAEQVEVLRRVIESISPDGFGNILDVTCVNATGGVNVMRALQSADVARIVGSERPTLKEARDSINRVASQLGRGDSVAFAVYDNANNPISWCFIGLTTD